MATTRECYEVARLFPDYERYALASQIRRSAVSIPSNIAEGASRGSDREFARFLLIAHASASELETQLLLARDFGYVEDDVAEALVSELLEIRRMLYSLSKRTRHQPHRKS
jgi:four helix bundle protein